MRLTPFIAFAAVLLHTAVTAQTQLVASDGSNGDRFGYSVSIDGGLAIVGAPFDSHSAFTHVGSAYIFEWSGLGWVEQAKIVPAPLTGSQANCGRSVDICERVRVAAVGAAHTSDDVLCAGNELQHRVYVHRWDDMSSAWPQEAVLSSPPHAHAFTTGFGRALSFSEDGEWLAVGAPLDDYLCDPPPPGCPDCNSGAVYLFLFDGTSWSLFDTLLAPDGATDDRFGKAVSMHGDVLVVGAWLADSCPTPPFTDCGAAYVYRFDGASWSFEQKLVAPDAFAANHFGDSVSVQGTGIIVGGREHGGSAGAVYGFQFNGSSWSFVQKLTASDGVNGDSFGWSVDRHRDTLIVGAPFHGVAGVSVAGAAYVFHWNGSAWVEIQKLVGAVPSHAHFYGFDVALTPGLIMAGVPADGTEPWPGAAVIH